jgi:histidine triad (HIT) family protein
MAMMANNIFLRIINREIPATIVHDDEHCLAFHDANPQAPVHVLVIPKTVIRTHADIAAEHAAVLGHIHSVIAKLAANLGLADGYRVVVNCAEAGGQTVPHLHFHLLGGRSLGWPPG